MLAAWYDRTGPASKVLCVGELPTPEAAPGEVRVKLMVAGINPKDVKVRAGMGGRTMPATRVVPGDDGAGVIDRVGAGVPESRIGRRVWVHSAGIDDARGTAAEYVVIPSARAVDLPAATSYSVGAALGVPALTAHHAVHSGGEIEGSTMLVTGGAGSVGRFAIAFGHAAGARVIATTSGPTKAAAAVGAGAVAAIDYRSPHAADQIRAAAGGPVDRVVDVALGRNLDLVTEVIAQHGVIAAYGSDEIPEPLLPFYPLMRKAVTVRLISVFSMRSEDRRRAISALTRLLEDDAFEPRIAASFPLHNIADAHRLVEDRNTVGKVVVRTSG